jgi:SAM-dependent methyltransferase
MDELSKEYLISFFNSSLMMHGDNPQAVRWTSRGQRLRYEGLLDIDKTIHGAKILDFGCGKGDFYQFLKDRNIAVQYTGYDINEQMISFAANKFPECIFTVFDLGKDQLTEDFDYIFLCGVFNLRLQAIEETIKKTLLDLFDHCRTALAFNALSAHDPQKKPELHYLYPGDMIDYAINNLSPLVSLAHDRVPYYFTMFVRKEAET